MASQPTADAPFGDGVSPVAPAPVVDATQQQFAPAPAPVAPVPATAPVEDAVVAEFRQLGYDIPSGMDRKTFLDQIASQIDNANKITSEWEAQKSASNPDAGIVAPAPIPTPAAPALSDTAKALQSQGLLKQGAGGVWVANDPNLKHFADEANSVHQYRQQQAQQLVDSPDKYITPHVETAFQQFASPIQKELAELKATMAADRQQKEDTRVDNWVNQNESQLFVGGDRQQFTPYAKSYNEFAAVADSNAQFLGKTTDSVSASRSDVETTCPSMVLFRRLSRYLSRHLSHRHSCSKLQPSRQMATGCRSIQHSNRMVLPSWAERQADPQD